MSAAAAAIFIITLFFGIYLVALGLQGTVVILVAAVVLDAFTGFQVVEPKHLVLLAILSVIVETTDAIVGISNAASPRLSRYAVVLSLVGGIIGAALLTPLFYGLGTITGLFLGGFAGKLLVERVERRNLKPSFRETGRASFIRNVSIFIKGTAAVGMTVFLLTHVYS